MDLHVVYDVFYDLKLMFLFYCCLLRYYSFNNSMLLYLSTFVYLLLPPYLTAQQKENMLHFCFFLKKNLELHVCICLI